MPIRETKDKKSNYEIYQKSIEEILENFDFLRVHKVMEFLGWTWAGSKTETSVPSIYELIKQAKRLLTVASEHNEGFMTGTGGFTARNLGFGNLELSFDLDSWRTENDDGEQYRITEPWY